MNKSTKFVMVALALTIYLITFGDWVTSAQANTTKIIDTTPTPISTPVINPDTPGEIPSPKEQEEIKGVVQQYFEIRYQALSVSMSKDFKESSLDSLFSDTPEASTSMKAELAKLAVEIKHAEINQLRYVDYTYSLDFNNFIINPITGMATVSVTEGNEVVYELSKQINPEDPIISRHADINHILVLHNDHNEWKIISDDYNDYLWRMLRQTGQSTDEMLLAMDIIQNDAIQESVKPAAPLIADPSSHPYDRAGAVAYASKYWTNYNPNYPTYDGQGGDCTNFVSQAIYEGGNASMYIPSPLPSPSVNGQSGWYTLNNVYQRASAWNDVNFFHTFVTNEAAISGEGPVGYNVTTINELSLGDVIQYDWDGDDEWDHAVIVVWIDGGIPFVSGHSDNVDSVVYTNFSSYNPGISKIRFIHIERSNGYPPVKAEVTSGVQDAGENNTSCINSYTDGNIYLGKCSNGTDITSGFQFSEVPIPSGATIKYAYITFTVDGPYTVDNVPGKFQAPIKLDIFGDPSGLDFSSTLPSTRTNLTSSEPWDISGTDILEYNHWEWKEKRTTPNVSSIVQQLVNSSWNYGDPLTFIFKNNSAGITEGIKVRRVMGFERTSDPTGGMLGYWSARLVAAYSFDGATGPTAPLVYSVTRTDPNPTNNTIVNFTVQFSEAVTGVDWTDFTAVMKNGVAGAAVVTGGVVPDPLDASIYTVQVNTGTGDGNIKLDVNSSNTGIVDTNENQPLNGGFTSGESYVIDKTPPSPNPFILTSPNPTNAATVVFNISFNESVTGVDINDFELVDTGVSGASIESVSPITSKSYNILVNTGSGDGTLSLLLWPSPFSSITDLASNPLYVEDPALYSGPYTIDKVPPSTSSSSLASLNPTSSSSVEFTVTFPEEVSGVDVNDFTLTTAGVFGAAVNGVSGSGSEYTITVDTGNGNGTIRLDIPVDASISDLIGNQLTGLPYTSGESYTVTKATLPFEGDEFNGPNLAEGWQWYVPNASPTYSLSAVPGALRMSLPVGGYFEHWGTDDYAPQLRHIGLDHADWAIETRLENINASIDAGYWAALTIGFDQYDQIWFGISDGNYLQETRTTDCCSTSLPDQDLPIMLRVEKLGENYTFLYKHDTDIDWIEHTTKTYVGTPAYVGLIGRSWNTGSTGLEFDWSYFHIEPWFAPLTVSSVTRDDLNPTNAGIAHFTVNFSEAVTGVDINDFALTTSGLSGTSITNVSGSGNSYTVAVQTGNGEGTLRLDVLDNDTIINSASRSLENGFTEGETYTIDRTAPSTISIVRANPNPTNQTSVGFTIDFSENVTGVDLSDFTLTTSGISGATLNGVSGIDNIYTVIVNTGSGNGTIRLNIADNDTIIDALGNPLGGVGIGNGSFTTGEVYTVDKSVLLSVTSAAAQDGYVLESTETSNVGGSVNTAATTLFVGDDVQDRQYLSLLSFGTSGLPDNAVIVSATLKLKLESTVGTNPFTTHNSLVVDIRQPYFGTAVSLQTNDFAAVAGAGSVATVGSTPQSGFYVATINTTGLTHISKTGTTQLRLRFLLDDNDDLGADYLAFYSANASPSTNRPVLEIVYYVP